MSAAKFLHWMFHKFLHMIAAAYLIAHPLSIGHGMFHKFLRMIAAAMPDFVYKRVLADDRGCVLKSEIGNGKIYAACKGEKDNEKMYSTDYNNYRYPVYYLSGDDSRRIYIRRC